jgi:hypothetical protein
LFRSSQERHGQWCSSPGHLEFFYSERGFPDASGSGVCSSKHYAMVQWQVVAFRAEK